NGSPCTCDLAGRLDYDLWSMIQHFDKARKTLDNYREIAQKGNLERSYVLQQQHDSLNARWSSSYGELQKEAQKRAHDLQKALKDLENMKAKLKEQVADSQTTDMAARELRATVELQNREIVRSRALHFQVENLEREMAECKSVNQAVEAVLVMKKQRITELESALEEMSVKTKQLAADKVEHESLKLQFGALEAEHAEALDIASGLFEGEVGSSPAELISQNRALGQQLRELRAENGSLVERLAGFGPERDGRSQSCKASSDSDIRMEVRGKRGLAYNAAGLVDYFFTGGNVCAFCGWAYNWDSRDNGLTERGLEYVPMLWSPMEDHTGRWKANVEDMIGKGSTHVLSFNECDIASQCNMTAVEAAEAHVEYMNPFSARVRIGAPAVSNSNVEGEGLGWLQAWVDVCKAKGCVYEFCTIHWYSFPENAADLFQHIRRASTICGGKPIWLTEFASLPLSQGGTEAAEWLRAQLPKLDGLDDLERYAFFMVEDGRLVESGRLTQAGEIYAGASGSTYT
ncbi:hypothetical protein ACHAQH_010011, partial [Verticillium albo-atrum]